MTTYKHTLKEKGRPWVNGNLIVANLYSSYLSDTLHSIC